MDGEEVGLGDHLVEAEQLDAHLLGPLLRHEGVVRHEAHAEALGPVGDQLADAAETDDAEGLVGEFDALPTAALPATVDEGGMGLRHVAGRGQQQRHRVLGGRNDVALRRVDHHHAAAGGRLDVDVVEADARATDDHQVGAGGQHGVGHVGGRADDQCARARDHLEQIGRRQVEPDVDVVTGGAEAVEAAVGNFFGDQDASHRPSCLSSPTPQFHGV